TRPVRTPRGRRARSRRRARWSLERPDLDRQRGRLAEPPGPAECGVEVGSFDDREAAQVFLAFGERAVGHQHVAVLDPHHGRGGRRMQAPGEHPGTRGLHLGVERVELLYDLLQDLGFGQRAVGLVDAEQVLLHASSSFTSWAGSPGLTADTNGIGPDRHRRRNHFRGDRHRVGCFRVTDVEPVPFSDLTTPEERLAQLDEAAAQHVATQRPANTLKAYAQDWQVWQDYTDQVGIPLLSASIGALTGFVVWLERGRTLRRDERADPDVPERAAPAAPS